MIVDRLTDEELAKIFVHMIYRDTEVEDYHSETVRMDEALYADVLRIVKSNLRKIARNHDLLASVKEEEVKRLLRTMYPTRALEFAKYADTLSYYTSFKVGFYWDEPILLQTEPPKDKAAYLLGGAFLEGCNAHWLFDDDAMCRINKDICNRVYTLICSGLLPSPSKRRLYSET